MCAPLGHSPDFDLIAVVESRPLTVQVKTTTVRADVSDGERWSAAIATLGGNQSWNGRPKHFDPVRVDYLFVHVGDGRRWFLPSAVVEARGTLTLGGSKYAEFEIEPGRALQELVYGVSPAPLESSARNSPGEYPSGQRTAAVNRLAQPSQVRILSPPSDSSDHRRERTLGRRGQAVVRAKRVVTLPLAPFEQAALQVGDRLRFCADGPGRVVAERIEVRSGGLP